ncbi:uncharacterized protein LOC131151154 [Malania oleifera]|uniref:uncharacterized protein LOC131151154 n=1 Tax=Malania oleifera TaxID=397392 RepID=UPI0025AE0877|nr:uncharacterized protein LOC131151154 [Malania oleifera]
MISDIWFSIFDSVIGKVGSIRDAVIPKSQFPICLFRSSLFPLLTSLFGSSLPKFAVRKSQLRRQPALPDSQSQFPSASASLPTSQFAHSRRRRVRTSCSRSTDPVFPFGLRIPPSQLRSSHSRSTPSDLLSFREKRNAGALTNFEVLDFLRSRGASKDPTRVIAPVAPSEFKVYDYLVQSVACNQTRECIDEFFQKCKKYDLAKAEVINIVNLRPSSVVEIYVLIEELENRIGEEVDELVEMVAQVLPPHPNQTKPGETNDEGGDVCPDGEQMDASS